ncbi:MAG: hypothetical protein O8C67_05045 [Candidatus Methanoperedens sp.]|nr:hypothetical protein [Candidatus Methanoperedens sp.]
MGINIEDGKGSGQLAQVESNRLRVTATDCSLSNHVTLDADDGGVYSVVATHTWAGAGTFYPLFIQNTDPNYLMVLEKINVEVVSTSGGTAVPNVGDYFSLLFASVYSAAGTPYTPININRTSTKVANVSAFIANPTLTVTAAVEGNRLHPQANGVTNDLIVTGVNDIVLGRNNTLAIRYITLTTAGTALVNLKFLMVAAASMG